MNKDAHNSAHAPQAGKSASAHNAPSSPATDAATDKDSSMPATNIDTSRAAGKDVVMSNTNKDSTATGKSAPPPSSTGNTLAPTAGFCRAITRAVTLHIPEAEADARFAELKAELPSRSARRMSRLGLMLSHLIGKIGISEDTVVIYASQFGEGRTLETYLDSFPQPSPLGFQSSIHPGGVEQALIFRQQPIREFFPLIASENLPFALFRTLELCDAAAKVLLLGGEEAATWLPHYGLAADTSFAFALLLEPQTPDNPPLGWLRACAPAKTPETPGAHHNAAINVQECTPDINTLPPCRSSGETLPDLCRALEGRQPIEFAHPDEGQWLIDWANS